VHAVVLADQTVGAGDAQVAAAVKATNRRLGVHQRVRGCTLWPDEDFPRTLKQEARRLEIARRLHALKAE
jgi:long-chain acyl-CoA synthetase